MNKTTITIVAATPTEVKGMLLKHLHDIEEYPSTVETDDQLLKRGAKGIVWHTEMNIIPEDTPQWRSINREVGEHVASVISDRAEVRAAYNRDGHISLFVSVAGTYNQILPDSYGEANPEGVYYSLADAMADLTTYLIDCYINQETRKICIWPDRDWCEWEDLEVYSKELGKSDDFFTVDVNLDIDDEKLDQLINDGLYDQGR
jgi:hypothetical protein